MLVAAVVAALVWANVDVSLLRARLAAPSSRSGSATTSSTYDLRTWVNSGLMTLFFLVVGLEARREFDLGDLRERRRFVLPFAAGLVGMAIPVLIYLAVNAGRSSAHGWGVAMSTDTALALGLLALLGRDVPDRVRVFLLTVFVVDDLAALVVIAVVYSDDIEIDAAADRGRGLRAAAGGRRGCGCGSAGVYAGARRGHLGRAAWPAASTRSSPGWRSGCRRRRTRRAAATSRRRPGWSASSASSRRPSWPARPPPG